MIPLKLTIKGFLSYREQTEIDFSELHVACISGQNGAGKSSLLDAMTWALFGQGRSKSDEYVINNANSEKTAEVTFDYLYEDVIYRIHRVRSASKKSASVDYYSRGTDQKNWQLLNAKTVTETNKLIQKDLRLDYDSFVNASFIQQGQADSFTKKKPGDRRETLMKILNLDVWDEYKKTAAEKRKSCEDELKLIRYEIMQNEDELAKETVLKESLDFLTEKFQRADERKELAEKAFQNAKQGRDIVAAAEKRLEDLRRQISEKQKKLMGLEKEITSKEVDLSTLQLRIKDEKKVQQDADEYASLQKCLEGMNQKQLSYKELTYRLAAAEAKMSHEESSLNSEVKKLEYKESNLLSREAEVERNQDQLEKLNVLIAEQEAACKDKDIIQQRRSEITRDSLIFQEKVSDITSINRLNKAISERRAEIQTKLTNLLAEKQKVSGYPALISKKSAEIAQKEQRQSELKNNAKRLLSLKEHEKKLQAQQTEISTGGKYLTSQIDKIAEDIRFTEENRGGVCPQCGQPLTEEHCAEYLSDLKKQYEELIKIRGLKRDEYRKITDELKLVNSEMEDCEQAEKQSQQLEKDLISLTKDRQLYESDLRHWTDESEAQYLELRERLNSNSFCTEERETLARLEAEYESYRQRLNELSKKASDLDALLKNIFLAEKKWDEYQSKKKPLEDFLQSIKTLRAEWDAQDASLLSEARRKLESGDYCPEERGLIAELDEEIQALGYDEQFHEQMKKRASDLKNIVNELDEIRKAKSEIGTLQTLIHILEEQIKDEQNNLDILLAQEKEDTERLQKMRDELPNFESSKAEYDSARMDHERVYAEFIGVKQSVHNLGAVKEAAEKKRAEEKEVGIRIAHLKSLESAFSKTGIPTMLIEQSLPEIEDEANRLLTALSDGKMSLQFITQKEYASKVTEEKKDVLEILISDEYGTRPYELFSGGEEFRINFAIRIALSKVLAKRSGAKLQTLVIDEGFGSQDDEGRSRLVEVIQAVEKDFALILVITHLNDLKDAFPSRIEVRKADSGTKVEVIA